MVNKMWKRCVLSLAAVVLAVGLMTDTDTIGVYAAQTESSQAASGAYLKSLSVDPGSMSPEFSPEITSYTITVDESVEKVSVTCSTAESDSKVVEAGGFKNLQPGSNDAVITVQAADGTKSTYRMTIIRGTETADDTESAGDAETTALEDESDSTEPATDETAGNEETEDGVVTEVGAVPISVNTETIPVGGDSIFAPFQVHTTFSQELIPEGFVEEDYDYKGTMVQSAYFEAGNIRLLYLTASDGTSADFRIYYEDTDSFMDFLQLKGTDGKFVMPVRYEAQIKIPDNYTGSFLPWGDKVIACYIYTELTDNPITVSNAEEQEDAQVSEEDSTQTEPVNVEDLDEEVEFYLLYAMNNEGEENFYLYDYVEGTYQRYVERDTSYELDQSYFKYKDVAHRRFAIMCVLGVLLVIAVFCIINLIMRNRELKEELGVDGDEDDEEDNEGEDDGEEGDSGASESIEEGPVEEKKPETPEKEEIPEKVQKPQKQKKPAKAEKPAKKEETVKEEAEIDTASLEEKIINQLQDSQEEPVRPRKPSNFKMINLSREPGPTGLDDDFEFEFIKLDDD